jgi:peroxiredoxin
MKMVPVSRSIPWHRRWLLAAVLAAWPAMVVAAPALTLDTEGGELLGRPAPPWNVGRWFNTPPITLGDLRGKVVLVRWFMSPRCPLCGATAPSLVELGRRYGDRGLVVVGMYHHKDPEPLDPEAVTGYLRHFGFTFPVAIDPDWRTLRRWWLDGKPRAFTSVSFLIDRAGVIRHIHPGGRLAPDSPDFMTLAREIERLLAQHQERASPGEGAERARPRAYGRGNSAGR